MDGTKSLVLTKKDSFYCSARGTYKKGSEKQFVDMCNKDPKCTGYDYRAAGNYGHLCKQVAYPGSSKKCCNYKLCKKSGGMYMYLSS